MNHLKSIFLTSALISGLSFTANAEINVVASVKPVHSLVSGVMDGIGRPDLIVQGSASPHTYSLRPSQARQLEDADLVFWMGHELESFLEQPLEAIATKAHVVELIDSSKLKKIKMREGGMFDAHAHDDHDEHEGHDDHDEHEGHDDHDEHEGHDDHDEHEGNDDHDEHEGNDDHDEHEGHDDHDEHEGHDDHDEHEGHDDHDEHEGHDDHDEHEGHDDHGHGEFDVHVWLDPENAKVLVNEIKLALIELDPVNASKYEANSNKMITKLDQLMDEVSKKLESEKGKGYVVFHDAYQYFEQRFGMSAVGSITVSPEVVPGANRIRELKEKINELNAHCVFSEPQFEPKLVSTVIEGTPANTGVLDPLGASIKDGPELYFTLIRNMADSLHECLSKKD
ncbi:metal ABC transporter solute-binding protein, Zn/Mn family [Pseudothioglobus sp. nBUS_23]|uniref:zinc ABC transporter substrate-binding protein n=1 Tax=Pseudothioglobus sp. nBUS_23 TaxID=3395318 RepID=UPI003EBF68AA